MANEIKDDSTFTHDIELNNTTSHYVHSASTDPPNDTTQETYTQLKPKRARRVKSVVLYVELGCCLFILFMCLIRYIRNSWAVKFCYQDCTPRFKWVYKISDTVYPFAILTVLRSIGDVVFYVWERSLLERNGEAGNDLFADGKFWRFVKWRMYIESLTRVASFGLFFGVF